MPDTLWSQSHACLFLSLLLIITILFNFLLLVHCWNRLPGKPGYEVIHGWQHDMLIFLLHLCEELFTVLGPHLYSVRNCYGETWGWAWDMRTCFLPRYGAKGRKKAKGEYTTPPSCGFSGKALRYPGRWPRAPEVHWWPQTLGVWASGITLSSRPAWAP